MEPRSQVKWFAEQMEERLRANDHKDGWIYCPTEYLLSRLYQGFTELRNEFLSGSNPLRDRIVKESADVANFAMMIADNWK